MADQPESIRLNVLQPDSCDECGLCCEGIGSPVLLYASRPRLTGPHPFRPPGMPQTLIDEIDETFGGLFRGQEPQDRCLWFDPSTRQCRHYEWRPEVCRDYELGGRACLQRREQHRRDIRQDGPPGPSSPCATGGTNADRVRNV